MAYFWSASRQVVVKEQTPMSTALTIKESGGCVPPQLEEVDQPGALDSTARGSSDAKVTTEMGTPVPKIRRFCARTFAFTSISFKRLSSQPKGEQAKSPIAPKSPCTKFSDKRAKRAAILVRHLIVGPASAAAPTPIRTAPSKLQLNKVKSQLLQPKSANKVIAQLRALPVTDLAHEGKEEKPCGPIHAVCLAYPEAEVDKRHFSPQATSAGESGNIESAKEADAVGSTNITTASISTLTNMLSEIHLINLIKSPDLGLGQPGDADGLLAGAVPTAETVINGITQITPQLMALGYATTKAVTISHTGVNPPTDRLSVLTYWWGFELALPPPTMAYLASVHSISNTLVHLLSALSLVNEGVREIIPFIRYISTFVDYEFNTLHSQDKGKGVVCAATWIMPAALVPRPWDFPPPQKPVSAGETHSKAMEHDV